MRIKDAKMKLEMETVRNYKAKQTALKAMDALIAIEDYFVENAICMQKGIRREDAETYRNIIQLFVKNVEEDS